MILGRALFLLTRPSILSIRNRWRGKIDLRSQAGRDFFFLSFSALVMLAVFLFTSWALQEANKNPTLAYIPHATLLSLIFLMLLGMLVISGILASLATFYLAEDLELILPTPVSVFRLFVGKFAYIFLVSSWMPFLFASPVLLAFGRQAQAGIDFYLLAPVLMIPYFFIPAAVGTTLATLLVLAIPVYRLRETFLVVAIALAVGGYFLIDSLRTNWDSMRSAREILHLMSLISAPSLAWLPSNWLGQALGELLRPTSRGWYLDAMVLWAGAGAALSLAFLVVLSCHDWAYSGIKNKRRGATYDSRGFQRWLRRIGAWVPSAFRALIGKELRILSRDVSQVVQLFMLLVLSLIYLYHLRIFSAVDSFPDSIRPWWKNFLFIGNVTMGSFITTAMCTRFVFPSVSLEGRSFWVVQTSPLEVRELVRMKFWCWLVPISVVSSLFFAAGAIAIGAESRVALICALSSFIVSYGVVGLAIGFGAYFAHFEWEHSHQLAGGFGSLLFMLSATVLIFLNMLPAWAVFFYAPTVDWDAQNLSRGLLLMVLVVAIVGVNIQAARIALRSGTESLLQRYA